MFNERYQALVSERHQLMNKPNRIAGLGNGVADRYENPVLTSAHVPLFWKYDLNPATNPYLMERFGVNAVFNSGAIKWEDRYLLMARVEGNDRKSFFALAESPNGIDHFEFRPFPVDIPEHDTPDANIYDIRLTAHEDGWIYGLFCTERKDPQARAGDESAAVARCGIVRTRDLEKWERLPDLRTPSPQQRNVVLHPEFVNGGYALYTRPQDGFIEAGTGGGIALGLAADMTAAVIEKEHLLDGKRYHTISEAKNGLGPAPIKTGRGWLHLAHGVRNTAAGLRYVLYLFMTDLHDLSRVIARPGGYFLAPEGEERVGDVSNVLFSNGWICDDDGTVFIYYASSDTRMHVATSTVDRLVDYCINTPEDGYRSATSVKRLRDLIDANLNFKG